LRATRRRRIRQARVRRPYWCSSRFPALARCRQTLPLRAAPSTDMRAARALGLSLLVLMGGCATSMPRPVRIPVLQAEPQCYSKELGKIVDCEERKDLVLIVLYDDWAQIVRALKGACLANGQSPKDCQTD